MRETEEPAGTIGRINATGPTLLLVEPDMGLVMNISREFLVFGAGRASSKKSRARSRAIRT